MKLRDLLLQENPPLRPGRIQNLDLLKLMSLVLVLCLHCPMRTWIDWIPQSVPSINTIVYGLGVLAIPTFFTVSGFQLLGRERDSYSYSLRKILNFLKIIVIFYLVMVVPRLIFIEHKPLSFIPGDFCRSLLNRGYFGVSWFIAALSIIYLIYPPLNRIYRNHKGWFLGVFLILATWMMFEFFITVVIPSDTVLNEQRIIQTFRLWDWLGYFCLGGLIRRYAIFRRFGKLRYVFAMTVIAQLFLLAVELRRYIYLCELTYSSPVIMLYVTVVFTYIMSKRLDSRFLAEMTLVFFPAYMMGDIFILLFEPWMVNLPAAIEPVIYVTVCAICSVTAAWLLMKIQAVRKLLSY